MQNNRLKNSLVNRLGWEMGFFYWRTKDHDSCNVMLDGIVDWLAVWALCYFFMCLWGKKIMCICCFRKIPSIFRYWKQKKKKPSYPWKQGCYYWLTLFNKVKGEGSTSSSTPLPTRNNSSGKIKLNLFSDWKMNEFTKV